LRDEGAFLTPNGFLMWRDKIVKSLRIARRPETIGVQRQTKIRSGMTAAAEALSPPPR